MGIMRTALGLLLPRGQLWRFIADAAALLDGLSLSLDRAKEIIDQARAESIPATALHTLPEWHSALGVAYDPTRPVEKQRAMLASIWTASGNSTREGLSWQIAKEYIGLTVAATGANAYEITGTVQTSEDARRVGAICAHFAPLHLIPTVLGYTAATTGNPNPIPPNPSNSSIISTQAFDRCGVGVTGLARCGKAS